MKDKLIKDAVRIQLYVDRRLAEEYTAMSKQLQVSRAQLFREALQKWLDEFKKSR